MRVFSILGICLGGTRLTPDAPLAHRYAINEVDGKCRTANALFLRLFPFRAGLILGRWRKTGMTREQMFKHVFSARGIELHLPDGSLNPRFAQQVRNAVGETAADPDDEWTILSMMGLDT